MSHNTGSVLERQYLVHYWPVRANKPQWITDMNTNAAFVAESWLEFYELFPQLNDQALSLVKGPIEECPHCPGKWIYQLDNQRAVAIEERVIRRPDMRIDPQRRYGEQPWTSARKSYWHKEQQEYERRKRNERLPEEQALATSLPGRTASEN